MRSLFSIESFFDMAPKIVTYLPKTLGMLIVCMFFGSILGAINALIRYKRVKILHRVMDVYNSFMRGTPLLVQLMLAYYGLPVLIDSIFGTNVSRSWDAVIFACIAMILNECAYTSAIFFGAIKAVPIGQTEAAYSVGLTYFQAFRRIIVPQAARIALPPFGNDFIMMFESTSVLYMIGVKDMLGRAQTLGTLSGHTLEAYVFVAIVYVLFSVAMRTVLKKINKRLKNGWSEDKKTPSKRRAVIA